ncbi:hypothetical protein LIA77_07123 [Sarocladium implicatum]|nr:hypothetical protein LIA77_07123 [Sarocladium implicatum]
MNSPPRDCTDDEVHHKLKLPFSGLYYLPPSPPPSPPTRKHELQSYLHQPSTTAAPTSQNAPFLRLSFDILYLITDQLDQISTYSLSLACRGTFAIPFPPDKRVLDPRAKRQLLTLLEKDEFGEHHFYCRPCNKLHPFESYWGPHSPQEKREEPARHCGQRDKFCPPCGNNSDLSFQHARLALNAYFWGPSHGIPLSNLITSHQVSRDAVTIQCDTSEVRVIHTELFLLRTYSFHIASPDVRLFRASIGTADFRICEHMPFFRASSVYHQGIAELSRRPSAAGLGTVDDGMVECEGAQGSCGLCLMDYETTIRRGEEGGWDVRIRAIHNVGSCRSPDDWKWARFTEKGKPRFFLPSRPNRRGSNYGPGAVRQEWSYAMAWIGH